MSKYKDLDQIFIDGKWSGGSSNSDMENLNPYTKKSIFKIKGANKDDVDKAYKAAAKAQKEWAETTPSIKRNIFDKAVSIMNDRKDEIKDWIIKESGGTNVKAETEWMIAMESLRVSSSYPYEVNGKIFPSMVPGKESRMYRKPLGVVTVISPWNFALNLTMRSVAPALATGNAVVLKPAGFTPVTGATLVAKIFEEAGLPKGLLNVVLGKGSEIGDYLVEHPTTKLVSFTGSTPVGRGIAEKAGSQFKKLSLELGGNNVHIVLDDADVDNAVDAAIFGKFMHQGQICMGINRILIADKIYDTFTDKFLEKAKALKVGDPSDENTSVGPIIDESQVEKISDMIDQAVKDGAKMLTDKKIEGNLIHPVVFSEVKNEMDIAQNEIFGPVALLIKFKDDEEAIKMANDTELGLSGAVHSGNTERALYVAKHIETGMVHINDQPVNDDANAVFGGEKNSGVGRFNGEFVKEEFTTTQWITVQHEKRDYAF